MAKQPGKVNRIRHNKFALLVLLILTALVVVSFRVVLPSKATSLNMPNRNLLFGDNLVLNDPSDAFLTSSALQTGLQNVHTQIIRLPVQGASPHSPGIANWSAVEQAAQNIKAMRRVPLVILRNPNDPSLLTDDTRVVTYINGLFGNNVVYYEFASDTDRTGNSASVTASAYTAAWNTIVPQLKTLEPSAQFIGPVNFQYDPTYLSTFLADANPQPDAISWHEYTCNASPNDGSSISAQEANCLNHINNDPGHDWPSHISSAHTLMTNTIGKQLPIWITEWNYASTVQTTVNSIPVIDPKASDAHFLTQWTTTALETLANNNVAASMHAKVNGLLPLVSDDGSVAPEGAAFQSEFLKLVSHSIPTPTSTTTNTPTPTSTVTNTSTPTSTATPDSTPTSTATPDFTPTVTATPDFTPTVTATNTPTSTPKRPPAGPPARPPLVMPLPPPVSKVIGQDDFHRANQTLWGTAADEKAWTGDANTLRNFSIFNDTAQIAATSSVIPTYNALLGAPAKNAEVLFSGSISSFNSSNLGATLRWIDANNLYKAYIDGTYMIIQKRVNKVSTILDEISFAASPNTPYTIRFQAVGTHLSAKVWPTGSAEPGAWMATASDNTFSSGYCGLRIQVSNGATATVTSFLAQPPSTIKTDIGDDTFQRADQAQWGTASDGQTWGGDANTGSNFSIVDNAGQVIAIPNSTNTSSAILGPSTNDAEVLVSGSMSDFNNTNFGPVLRWTDTNNWYKAYIEGNNLIIQRKVDKVATALQTVSFAARPNTSYTIHFRVVGTTLSANVWPTGSTEPSGWMATTTDSSLTSGYCGMRILVINDIKATMTSFQARQVP